MAGEALADSLGVGAVLELATQVRRPLAAVHPGFFQGGESVPSNQSLLGWTMASGIAHEYPGWITQASVDGAASAVSLFRVSAKKHFPSDVIRGSALGYFIGRQVYNAHPDPELGGSAMCPSSHAPDEGQDRVVGSRSLTPDLSL